MKDFVVKFSLFFICSTQHHRHSDKYNDRHKSSQCHSRRSPWARGRVGCGTPWGRDSSGPGSCWAARPPSRTTGHSRSCEARTTPREHPHCVSPGDKRFRLIVFLYQWQCCYLSVSTKPVLLKCSSNLSKGQQFVFQPVVNSWLNEMNKSCSDSGAYEPA